MYEHITEDVEAVKYVLRFHKWLITTMNGEFPPVDDMCSDKTILNGYLKIAINYMAG